MYRFRRGLSLALAFAMLLWSSCLAQSASETDSIVLPEPADAGVNMILGESSTEETRDVTLYFSADNSTYLSSTTHTIPLKRDESLIEAALNQLLSPRFSNIGQATASADVKLIDVEFGCGIATVDLSVNSATLLSDQNELLRACSIANTLLGLEGVQAVNILTGGRSDGVSNLPLGAFTQQYEGISALHAQLQSEEDLFLQAGSGQIRRSVILYYPSASGYFLPELRSLQFDNEDYATVILNALKSAPQQSTRTFSPIPDSSDLFAAAPQLRINEAGERVLDLRFSEMLSNYLAFSGVEPWQFYGSLVLSLCSFIPELDGVCMTIDGEAVTKCMLGERELSFSGGCMRRSDFSAAIGSSAALYFTGSDGKPARVECAMSQADAASARGLLIAMMSSAVPEGMQRVFPEGVFSDDILGVSISRGVATVNLSGNFYTRCQNLSAAAERNLVYAMVNTLCELPEIGAVGFLVEGMRIEALCENIYLKTALLPDPGLG